jgi:hypothetical protein
MSERYFTYERDGETYFAVWSTVVDAVTWYDMTREEFEDWYVEREAAKAREHITDRADALASGENPYHGLLQDLPPDDVVEKLKRGEEL